MSGHSYIGNTKIKHVYYGTTKIKKIYSGTKQVWSGASVVTYRVDSGVTETREVDEGQSVLTYTPTKSGWTFLGWRDDSTASSSVHTTKVATGEPMTLYAVFKANVTLTYNGNGNTGGSTSAETKTRYYNNGNISNPSFTIKANGFSKTNYTFYRWRSGASSGTIYTVGSSITLSSNTTIYAYWIVTTTNFGYTGGMQSFTMLAGVTYLCKVWGAQGGGFTIDKRIDGYMRVETYDAGGKGGYAQGNKKYNSNTTVYIGVGGKPAHNSFKDSGTTINNGGYNGGGKAGNDNASGSGGGATHIGLSNAVLASTNSSNVLLVAGGGGGCAKCYLSDASYSNPGGYGGGASGQNGQQQVGNFGANFGYGGTQTAGGSRNGAYGKGGSASDGLYAAGGGGGYYGGGAGYTYNGASAGGGGSGYIGGVTNGSTSGNSQTGNGYAQIIVSAVS